MTTYNYAVTGDHSRLVYSQHKTASAAERARRQLARHWGHSHPGSEPRVVKTEPMPRLTEPTHIGD